jgi:ornithine decarboxylase
MVGEAGVMVTSVTGKARRGDETWLYLDVGVFNGLMEVIGGIKYRIVALREGMLKNQVLAGPSCDSMDVIAKDVELPDLEINDRVCIMSTGAYTTVYAARFNGFTIPRTYVV